MNQHNIDQFAMAGKPLAEAKRVLLMVHGRGATAQNILSLCEHFEADDFAFIAPQATQNSWYPHSFLMPTEMNEPKLSSALAILKHWVEAFQNQYGFASEQIYFLGFSQGACLALEFVAQNAAHYGGVFGLSGGLIGPENTPRKYAGDFDQTPIFLGCSDVDSHIPKERVLESDQVFKRMNANVLVKLYPNLPHTINEDEIAVVNAILNTGNWPQ